MGGVILLVAWNLIDFHHIHQVLSFSKSESAILLTTFAATLFLELEFAIYLGVLLSLILFLARTSTPYIPTLSVDDTPQRKLINVEKKPLYQCPQLKIIRIDMSVYFGSINHIQKRLAQISDQEGIKHILIVATGINFIDLAGAEALVAENRSLMQQGGGLYFVGMKSSVYEFAAKSCFIQKIGNDHFFDSKAEAITRIYQRLDRSICAKCHARIFRECNQDTATALPAG
jgi:SulP family sulfate permease